MATNDKSKKEGKVTVNVHFLGFSQDNVGVRDITISLEGLINLKDLLKELATKIGPKFHENVFDPHSGKLSDKNTIIINGRHYSALDGLETPLKSGDEISFFPPLGGGSF
ncbi:MAG: MoaD/ThiS family protein [Candidatus Helarchaeota archaeon]|nr:MoaD/ThiS family protein [Candidatus Helarchaeota archaeon]